MHAQVKAVKTGKKVGEVGVEKCCGRRCGASQGTTTITTFHYADSPEPSIGIPTRLPHRSSVPSVCPARCGRGGQSLAVPCDHRLRPAWPAVIAVSLQTEPADILPPDLCGRAAGVPFPDVGVLQQVTSSSKLLITSSKRQQQQQQEASSSSSR